MHADETIDVALVVALGDRAAVASPDRSAVQKQTEGQTAAASKTALASASDRKSVV